MALVIQATHPADFEQLEKAIEYVNATRFGSATLYIHRKAQKPIECNVKERTIILLGHDAKVFLRWAKEQCCLDRFGLILQSRYSKKGITEDLHHAFTYALLNRHRTFVVPSVERPALDTGELELKLLLGSAGVPDPVEESQLASRPRMTSHVAGKKQPEKINTHVLADAVCRINKHGVAEICQFLASLHKESVAVFTPSFSLELATMADNATTTAWNVWLDTDGALQIAKSLTKPIIEIKPWESVSGQAETYEISDEGVDVTYHWRAEVLDMLCDNTVKKITVEQSEHEIGFFCETFQQPWEVFFKKEAAENGFVFVKTRITHDQELRQAIHRHPWMAFLSKLTPRYLDSLLAQFMPYYFFEREKALDLLSA